MTQATTQDSNLRTLPAPSAYPQLIRNIWAVGRNYAEHAKELGNAVPQALGDPMIFLKAGSSAVPSTELGGGSFALPTFSKDIHHEAEIALQFGDDFTFSGIAFALDLTAREVQSRLKEKQHPWTLAKSFTAACPLSEIKPLPADWDPAQVTFQFSVNGALRQSGRMQDMIFSAEKLRQFVLECFPVVPGDLLLTGTPSGVGLIQAGDHLQGEVFTPNGAPFLKTSWQVQS